MAELTVELQKWRSHKIVKAGKILHFDEVNKTLEVDIREESYKVSVTPVPEWWERAKQAIVTMDEGYFVEYEDGYQSWSPTKAFEEGYTKVEEDSITITRTKMEWKLMLSFITSFISEQQEADISDEDSDLMDNLVDELKAKGL